MNRADMRFQLTLCGPDLKAIVERFVARGEPFNGTPAVVRLDAKGRKATQGWLSRWFDEAQVRLVARWGTEPTPAISISPGRSCSLAWPESVRFSERQVLDLLVDVAFAYGTTGSLYAAWLNDARYKGRIIGPDLQTLGWACYFKPPGLARIPSRWFEHGPWLTLKGAGDVTLTTFHDLAADADTALEQAVPCHEWMWWGFAQEDYREFSCDLSGRYDAATRTHEIVVGEREFTEWYPFEASIAGFEQRFPHGQPVDHVAFVFKSSKQAEAHLHRLWLYEMQCWTETESGERKRLDLEYSAKPVKPPWVAELETRLKAE